MEAWLREFFGWLPSGGSYYLLIGLISFLESLVAVGIFVPGSVLIVFAGFLSAHGKGTYPLLMLSATLGAIVGDLISYWVGARLGLVLMEHPLLRKRQAFLKRAEFFFVSHGGKSVFIGRFVGLLRPFIPFVAGASRMKLLPFAFFVVFSGILWGLAYPGLGYFFGASWKLVQLWTGRFSLFIAIVAGLLVLDAAFWKWGAPAMGRFASRSVEQGGAAWERCRRTPFLNSFRRRFPRLWEFMADRLTLRRGSGLFLTLGFTASLLFAALLALLARASRLEPSLLRLDSHIHTAIQSFHHPLAEKLFLLITLLGSWPVLLALGGLLLLWLVLYNRDFSATILIIGTGGGFLLIELFKRLFERPGPEALSSLHLSAEIPGNHIFLVSVFYGLAVYMLIDHLDAWRSRFNLVFFGTFLALLIGASRIYLGIHWFSEVLGSFALAALWLTILITASEMRRRSAGEFPWHTGWEPVRITRRSRTVILALGSLASLGALLIYLLRGAGVLG